MAEAIQLMMNIIERNVIFSIRPEYADKIMSGNKTVELRRRFANEAVIGAIAFIYSSAPAQRMIGYATIRDVRRMQVQKIWRKYSSTACITKSAFDKYFAGTEHGYAIELTDVTALDEPISARELTQRFGFRAPQSYQYAKTEYSSLIA
jgi:predicted transcriptional regulator